MNIRRLARLVILIPIIAVSASNTASAAAIVDVTAAWFLNPLGYFNSDHSAFTFGLPAGIEFSCSIDGGAFVQSGACLGDSLTLSGINTGQGPQSLAISRYTDIVMSNVGTTIYTGPMLFITDFSAFAPGSGGITINDPTQEYASYSSGVTGPNSLDSHFCAIPAPGDTVGPVNCVVGNPDFSESFFELGIPAPGDSTNIGEYSINISADLIGIPEPATLTLFGAGLVGAIAMRRRKFALRVE